ncbi:MAG TPA: FdhF/YdeP family oxidoreductase [Candidatus Limnocylindrales bacterium]|nr:FdhF/YdeP family oxidoreductase [Candidatus Limnocylindrales bacterium]
MSASAPSNGRNWVSLVPYGLNEQHPNNYKDIVDAMWENRDNLGYAWRVLRDGCCDGCSLGTTGMYDWTMKGVHLCAVRLAMLRFNTMPAMDWRLLEDVAPLKSKTEKQLRKLGRLSVPMVRRKGEKGFRRVSWDEALQTIADKVRATDPKKIGWYLTSRGLTNEAYYAHQKVARFIGTNHVDTSARICHAPSTAGLGSTVGCAATTCSYSDWIGADLIVFVGANPANNQPVTTKYLYYAKKAGTKVFVVNPYNEPGMQRYWVPSVTESALFGTKIADDFFQVHVGGDIPFFYGVIKHLIENNWTNREFIAARTAGWEQVEAKVAGLSWETLERSSGQTREEMFRFAEKFGQARHAIIVWSMGITQHRYGSDNVRAIVNLQLAKGNIGRPHTGLMPIRGHSGVQGGAEMGGMPTAYVMGFPVTEENAKKFATPEVWGFEPPTWKGLSAAHMVLAAGRGEVDILWQSGGNFKQTLPEPDLVESALGNIKLRVHQDIVTNPTMLVDPADTVVLLPTRTRYEQKGGGTETSTERRIIYSPQIPGGPDIPEAKDEWEIPVLLAQKLNPARASAAFPWKDTQDIRNEIDRVCPTYKGIAGLKKKGDNFQYGGERLLVDRCLTPDGKGHFTAVEMPEEKVPEGRFLLATRRGKQFNSIINANVDPITGARRDDVLMSREDAERLQLRDGDPITLRNELGEFHGRLKIDRVKPGSLQAHWPEINVLVPAGRLDPSGVPDYNATVEVVAGRAMQAATA